MLKGIDPLLGPELLATLRAMGHADEIAIVDANFPAAANARRRSRVRVSPFLSWAPSIRTPCARTAPSASSIGVKPNFMPPRFRRAAASCAAKRRSRR